MLEVLEVKSIVFGVNLIVFNDSDVMGFWMICKVINFRIVYILWVFIFMCDLSFRLKFWE